MVQPEDHPVRQWASEWHPTKNDIYVPEWFTEFYPLKRKMDNKRKNLISFDQNWHQAWKDGWIIVDNKLIPPKNHEATHWTAEWYTNMDDIKIPHWFIRFYPLTTSD